MMWKRSSSEIRLAEVGITATNAFDHALKDVDLVRKAVNTLCGLARDTAGKTMRPTVRDLLVTADPFRPCRIYR